MLTLKHAIIPALLLLVSACTSDENDETESQQSQGQSNILKDQLKAVEKAKGVEKVLQDAAEKHRQAADQ